MTLIPVIKKRSRLCGVAKYWGGLLNPKAHYYVQRTESNQRTIIVSKLIANHHLEKQA